MLCFHDIPGNRSVYVVPVSPQDPRWYCTASFKPCRASRLLPFSKICPSMNIVRAGHTHESWIVQHAVIFCDLQPREMQIVMIKSRKLKHVLHPFAPFRSFEIQTGACVTNEARLACNKQNTGFVNYGRKTKDEGEFSSEVPVGAGDSVGSWTSGSISGASTAQR